MLCYEDAEGVLLKYRQQFIYRARSIRQMLLVFSSFGQKIALNLSNIASWNIHT